MGSTAETHHGWTATIIRASAFLQAGAGRASNLHDATLPEGMTIMSDQFRYVVERNIVNSAGPWRVIASYVQREFAEATIEHLRKNDFGLVYRVTDTQVAAPWFGVYFDTAEVGGRTIAALFPSEGVAHAWANANRGVGMEYRLVECPAPIVASDAPTHRPAYPSLDDGTATFPPVPGFEPHPDRRSRIVENTLDGVLQIMSESATGAFRHRAEKLLYQYRNARKPK